ncbi:MAG: hypothetical protein IPO77_16945 [Acidobacteria bacterium]|nr:hypothetical protein [Acidobacteriota bacterium]
MSDDERLATSTPNPGARVHTAIAEGASIHLNTADTQPGAPACPLSVATRSRAIRFDVGAEKRFVESCYRR